MGIEKPNLWVGGRGIQNLPHSLTGCGHQNGDDLPALDSSPASPAAYSDLASLRKNTIACLYECGEKAAY
jgi:hypothetical protein